MEVIVYQFVQMVTMVMMEFVRNVIFHVQLAMEHYKLIV